MCHQACRFCCRNYTKHFVLPFKRVLSQCNFNCSTCKNSLVLFVSFLRFTSATILFPCISYQALHSFFIVLTQMEEYLSETVLFALQSLQGENCVCLTFPCCKADYWCVPGNSVSQTLMRELPPLSCKLQRQPFIVHSSKLIA